MSSLRREIYKAIYPDISLERIEELKEIAVAKRDMHLAYDYYFGNRKELVSKSIRQAMVFSKIMQKQELNRSEKNYLASFYPEISGITSIGYFNDAFNLLASPNQITFYKYLIDSYQIVGCYAQTELGNGSNMRLTETQAIYDSTKKIFIINSPTITSAKFWVGGMGLNANFAIVIARLIIEEKDYGPHPFLVQIRNLRSHLVASGAFLGEIGPKMGLDSTDQGYARFEFLSVPKSALLNRFWDVDDHGNYSQKADPAMMLTMTHIIARINTIKSSWVHMATALSISIKYSHFRTQFLSDDKSGKEMAIIQYQSQQEKLFPGLSRFICFLFASSNLYSLLDDALLRILNGDLSLYNELNMTSCLFKASITSQFIKDIESCRQACGGHGYLLLSGLPSAYKNSIAACTYAGDNTVLTIQLFRDIIRLKPKRYWQNIIHHNSSNGIQRWLNELAKYYLLRLDQKVQKLIAAGVNNNEIWSDHVQIDAVATLGPLFLAISHQEVVDGIQGSDFFNDFDMFREVYVACELKKYEGLLKELGMKESEWEGMIEKMYMQYKTIVENSLMYVEAIGLPDEVLNSVLAKQNPYEEMLWTAKVLNPVNDKKTYEKVFQKLRPKL